MKQRKEEGITQTELLKAFAEMQDDIVDQQKEGEQKGFTTEREMAVYDSMKVIFDGEAEDANRTVFDLIQRELNIIGWEGKGTVKKDMENKIMRYLKIKMERSAAKEKAREIVEIMEKNKDA